MAFDGITVRALADELSARLEGKKISKIAQPENEELLITARGGGETVRLLASANASLPLCYLTEDHIQSPPSAPNFCMVLRKYIGNRRILAIEQPGLERVISLKIEHLDEMRDTAVKFLFIELMGKHSNIIFTDENLTIIDSIKHIGAQISSVREVLPGRKYFIPAQEGKKDALSVSEEDFLTALSAAPESVCKAIYRHYIGFSPQTASEIALRCGIDPDVMTASLTVEQKKDLCQTFFLFLSDIKKKRWKPALYLDPVRKIPTAFAPFPLTGRDHEEEVFPSSVSELLYDFYTKKNTENNVRQRSQDLRKNVGTLLEREQKKLMLQEKQLSDTDKMDHFRVCGELLHTYGNQAEPGTDQITVDNYYTGKPLKIVLDPTLSAADNAKRYFERYDKLKRTKNALSQEIDQTREALRRLQSIETSLMLAENEEDLNDIREELSDYGFLRKKSGKKNRGKSKSRPLHFLTDDGFSIYVGKNNYQNDELTFKTGSADDWWFHAKQIPGSHVLVKTEGKELPDRDFEIASELAAYYSAGRDSDKIEVDYLRKKDVKKPSGAAAGYVIYHTNYSMMAIPRIEGVRQVSS